jgi:succinate dehydrogenase / fumarate reductase, cytochrome b subunit
LPTAQTRARPLSPHLTIWKWGPHMAVSIFHRATGTAMALAGTVLLVWWLAAAATGASAYDGFLNLLTVESGGLNIPGYVLGIGLTWAFFQHLGSGVRHLFLDIGALFELKRNKAAAVAVFVFAPVATLALWAYLIWGK